MLDIKELKEPGYRVMHMPCLTLLLPLDVAEKVDDKAVDDAVAWTLANRKKDAEAEAALQSDPLSSIDVEDKKKESFGPGAEIDECPEKDSHNKIASDMETIGHFVQKMICTTSEKVDSTSDYEEHKEKPKHLVFAWQQAHDLEKRTKTIADADTKEILKRYAKEMRLGGGRRPVGTPTLESLDILQDQHPNFSEVIVFIRNKLLLAEKTNSFLKIPPILLCGNAGVGKTHFSKSLASALNTSIHRLAFDGPISSSALIGMDRQWGNTRAGLLFNAIVLGRHANPVFVLDELDKARASRQDDPLAPLHTLWESGTAGEIKDLSTEVVFDASLVTWVATANNPLLISPTLRSRLREFWIAMPEASDAIKITRYVAASVIENSAPLGFSLISDRLSVLLAHLTPREVVKAVGDAVACAVANGRMEVTKSDFSAEALAEDVANEDAALLH